MNPKMFSVNIIRAKKGDLHLVGGDTETLDRRTNEWVSVNTRDFASLINSQGVHSA